MRMRATFKSLPKDPIELRVVSELMAAEIKSQAYLSTAVRPDAYGFSGEILQ
jgi:hypothetical protein